MDTVRIAALLKPFLEQPLSALQLEHISTYIDILQRWNARINLTAIRTEEEIVTRHFGESLFLARHLFPSDAAGVARTLLSASDTCTEPSGAALIARSTTNATPTRVLDIGSGAGFPALPLKIWAPHLRLHLTLIESNHKKATFLREVARALTLTDINVIAARAETISAQAEVVTLRAVEHFETILSQAQAFLAPNGSLALLIGSSQLTHLKTQTKLIWNPPIPVPQSQERVLSIGILR
jgi:16S rRNA (guanine527-N7)-methyltransferase